LILRSLLLFAAVALVACSSPPEIAPSTKLVTSSPAPVGSPDGPTPTAIISRPAPSAIPSPSPSPSPVARSSPVAIASPAASLPVTSDVTPADAMNSPLVAAMPSGPRYAVVSDRSQATYRARETFVGQEAPADAVGTTRQISGEIELERDGLPRGRVLSLTIDLRTLSSGQARRDAYVRDNTLQTAQHPFATFRSTTVTGPIEYQPGDEVTFQIPGLMTIRGQERPIVWDVRARIDGDTLTGSATSWVKLTDFGLAPPRLAVLSVEDEMTWEVTLVAMRVP
jgi:polyisoprenoid-binding protein YceI